MKRRLVFTLVALLWPDPVRAQQGAADSARSDATKAEGPLEPRLRQDYAACTQEIAALGGADEAQVASLDERIRALVARLREAEPRWAVELALGWSRRLRQRAPALALSHVDAALAIARTAGDEQRIGAALLEKGSLSAFGRRADEALAAWDEAAAMFTKVGDERGLGLVAVNRGVLQARRGEIAAALASYGEAAAVFQKVADERGLAHVAHARGNLFSDQGRFEEALAAYDEAAQIALRLGDDEVLGSCTMNRGMILSDQSRYEEALAAYGEAAAIFAKLGHDRRLANIILNRGEVFRFLGRYEAALAAYDEAEKTFAKLEDPSGLAHTVMARGYVFQFLSRYEEALTAFDAAAKDFTAIGDKVGLAKTTWGRGNVCGLLGRHDEAFAAFSEAGAVFTELGDEHSLAKLLMNHGEVRRYMGQYETALSLYDEAAVLLEKMGDAGSLADIALNRAIALGSLGRSAAALAECDAATKVFTALGDEVSLARLALNRGRILHLQQQHAAALRTYESAAGVFERLGDLASLVSLAVNRADTLHAMQRHAEALQQYFEGASRLRSMLFQQVQRLGPESSEGLRSHFRDVVPLAFANCRLLGETRPDALAQAYQVLQTFHGLGMTELLAERSQIRATVIPDELRYQLTETQERLRAAIAARDALRLADQPQSRREQEAARAAVAEVQAQDRALTALIEKARLRSRSYVDVTYPEPATLAAVQAELDPGCVLVELALGDEQAWAVVTTRERSQLVDLGGARAIAAAADGLATTLGRQQTPSKHELRNLGQRVLDPVLACVAGAGASAILFAPHGALCRIPLELLLTGDGGGDEPTTWPYLVASHDVAYVHSGTVLVAMRKDARDRRPPPGIAFAGIGHPFDAEAEGRREDQPAPPVAGLDADRGGRRPLPGSAREVLEIARVFATTATELANLDRAVAALDADSLSRAVPEVNGARFRVWLREHAHERTLKTDPAIKSARIVHLACHGEADLDSPSLSRLVLARSARLQAATGEDGYVYVRDLRDLDLACELLVLSACESTPGRLSLVEGMTGMARAGLAGGAQAVASTLWRVGDASAPELMVTFYRGLADGASRIRALSQAKRAAIASGMPMRTWSAYVLWDAHTRG